MNKVLVLLSGGQDSATCLALATRDYEEVYSISFDYGQRHVVELTCSKKLAELAEVVDHFVVSISSLKALGGSALITSNEDMLANHLNNKSLPASFVPGRNFIFLGLASAKAFQLGIHHLMIGTCQIDFSGYPDCRDSSVKAIQAAIFLSFDYPIYIHTPLMWRTKAETVLLMKDLARLNWYEYTHTCYEGKYPPCLECPACKLRRKGFEEAGVGDPLLHG